MEHAPKTAVCLMLNSRKPVMGRAFAVVAAVIALQGCGGGGPKTVEYAREYPAIAQGETLDIQVFRRTKTIELTNTSSVALGPSTLWLNKRYALPIEGLAVGQSMELQLEDFRDEYSEAFRAGGFFAIERPEPLVLTQVETKNTEGKSVILGLVTIRGTPEDE